MTHRKRAKDFKEHAKLCERLLRHYSSQYLDRQVYWRARQRSITAKDMLTVIVDTFDRSKLSLPKWPYQRTPKRTCYEMYLRASQETRFFHPVFSSCPFTCKSCFFFFRLLFHLRGVCGAHCRDGTRSWLLYVPITSRRYELRIELELGMCALAARSNVCISIALGNTASFEIFLLIFLRSCALWKKYGYVAERKAIRIHQRYLDSNMKVETQLLEFSQLLEKKSNLMMFGLH